MTATADDTLIRPKLTLQDRCEHCGGEALVRFAKPPLLVLDFCGHHSARFMIALLAHGWEVAEDKRTYKGE